MLSFEDDPGAAAPPARDADTHSADVHSTEHQAPDGHPAEGGTSAARVLELAAQTAEQLVEDAKAEAESLVAAAHAEAGEARQALAEEKAGLEARIDALRRQQETHRTQLREHLAHQLSLLDGVMPEPPAGITDPASPAGALGAHD